MNETERLTQDREKTHGDYTENAEVYQTIMATLQRYWRGEPATAAQQFGLSMIAGKIARITTGDANFADHWQDIEGYAFKTRETLNNATDV